jgi:hypothetical protein
MQYLPASRQNAAKCSAIVSGKYYQTPRTQLAVIGHSQRSLENRLQDRLIGAGFCEVYRLD